ncbi:hypothetical protein NQ315_014933 [Exocentrus adspersus]|uniref:Mutator-like transposase domain-containing protein n=1 Tax=Exocentrus adspersus TaxID=1586481 RepID=A0AAV8VAE4_9CUCU|nr:hypothetical protein NQ315_014933 [Exocentrus adspersus]
MSTPKTSHQTSKKLPPVLCRPYYLPSPKTNTRKFIIGLLVGLVIGIAGLSKQELTNLLNEKVKDKAVCFTLKLLLQKLKFRGNFSLHLEVSKVSTWLKLCVDTSHYVHQILAMTDFLWVLDKESVLDCRLELILSYTGHCFRRSSTSILADSGADLLTIKRHGGWKSNTVAGYIDTSKETRRKFSKILGEETPSANRGPKKNVSGINLGHVWGTLATGSSYEHSAELMSCMNIPTMPQKQFQNTNFTWAGADGDSSVFAKIKTNVSYGNIVKKVECTNNAIKNYGKHLRQIKKDTSINIEGRKLLTINHIEKLTRRAKCSIYEHSQTEENNVQLLKEDLQNGINHVFGDHSKCREGICNIVGDQSNNKVPQLKSSSIYNHLKDYGPKAEEPELDPKIVAEESQNIINDLQVDEYRRDEIAKSTVGQFGNDLYECERERRLTASLFGSVISRKEYTPCHNLVKSCLQPTSFYSKATSFGIAKESVAIALIREENRLSSLIGSNALIEVKCLYSCSDLQVRTIEEVQGQLNICQREKCYFVVYINDEIEVYIEEIKRDEYFWRDKMLPKLIKFYTECIAPEIIRGNLKKNKKCLDPEFILKAMEERNAKKRKDQVLMADSDEDSDTQTPGPSPDPSETAAKNQMHMVPASSSEED